MELELEGKKLKVYESGEIYRLYKKGWLLRKGNICDRGYICYGINNKKYYTHRIVYKAFNPDWDIHDTSRDNQIDHKNRVRNDNRICNLRVVSNAENAQNTNCKGYSWCNTWKKWVARVHFNGKKYTKRCKTEEEAIEAVLELRLKHFPFYERTAIPEGE